MVAKKNGKDYDMVEVLWIDAEEHGEIGWNNLKAQLKYAKKPCPLMRSIGFEVWRDDDHIALLSSIGDKECSSVEKIPMGFIHSITILNKGKTVKLTSETKHQTY